MTKRKKKKPHSGRSIRLAILFCLLVGGLIFFSLLSKLLIIIKNSTFDGEHRFTIVVSSDNKSNTVISFAPKEESVSVLHINGIENSSNIEKIMEIPVDGKVASQYSVQKNLPDTLKVFLLRYTSITTNLTIIDLARLWWFSQALPKHAYTEKSLSLASKDFRPLTDIALDKLSAELFTDETIALEKISIQIVNATSVSGLGNRFARLVGNMGGNVISVVTAEKEAAKSSIQYFGEKSYTVIRLEKIIGIVSTPMQNPGLADIIVTIGKDSENATAF